MKLKKDSGGVPMVSIKNGAYIDKGRVEGLPPAPLNLKQEQAPKKEIFKLTHKNSKSKYC